jgi:hypothetical protein
VNGEDGRVVLLPKQIDRLAELSAEGPGAIEVLQYGSVITLNNGRTKLKVNANGDDIHQANQEHLW